MMTRLRLVIPTLIVALLASPSHSEVTRGQGGPMKFDASVFQFGFEFQNPYSTLRREWVIVSDEEMPARLVRFTNSTLQESDGLERWFHVIEYDVETTEDLRAIEVRFIPFDIWGDPTITLTGTDIADLSAGTHSLDGQWRISSDSDAIHHYAMLGYVAQVKLATGEVVRADIGQVLEEARQFAEDFSAEDLSPED